MGRLLAFALIASTALLNGCAYVAPHYKSSPENVQSLNAVPKEGINVLKFVVKNNNEASISDMGLRGAPLASPYNHSYVDYLENALRKELAQAGKLNPESGIAITGMLLKNRLDAGMSVGVAEIEVEFMVITRTQALYKKTHSARHEWPSSLAATMAIPAAKKSYHVVVQKLLASLFSDPGFVAAVNKKP